MDKCTYFQIEEDSQILRQTSAEQDQYEMQVRAANIVSLMLDFYHNSFGYKFAGKISEFQIFL